MSSYLTSFFILSLIGATFWVASQHEEHLELPEQTCKQARKDGLDYSSSIPAPPPAPIPLPFPELPEVGLGKKIPTIYNKGRRVRAPRAYLPYDLPLQPFEGAPVDIGKVGQAMRDLDRGARVRMTFFGASHTGGDYWTGHLRRILQARYGDIGHGFTMPVPMYRSARAHDINLCASDGWIKDYVGYQDGHDDAYYGLGMAASSSDPEHFTWLETTHQNPVGRNFDTLDIFLLAQPEGGTALAQIDRNDPIIIPTEAANTELIQTRIEVLDGSHRLTLSPAGDGEIRLFGVSVENTGPGVLVDSIGIRGREARTWLKWDDKIFQSAINSLNPDIIVLAYGTNEANSIDYTMEHYARDLRRVLSKLREAQPNKACILVGPSDRGKSYKKGFAVWERTSLVADVQREVAPEFGCVFWDWHQAMGGDGSMIAWRYTDPPLAAADLIHHTSAGYAHIAERFMEALDDAAINY